MFELPPPSCPLMKHQSQIQILNHATAYEDEDFDKSYDSRSDSVTG